MRPFAPADAGAGGPGRLRCRLAGGPRCVRLGRSRICARVLYECPGPGALGTGRALQHRRVPVRTWRLRGRARHLCDDRVAFSDNARPCRIQRRPRGAASRQSAGRTAPVHRRLVCQRGPESTRPRRLAAHGTRARNTRNSLRVDKRRRRPRRQCRAARPARPARRIHCESPRSFRRPAAATRSGASASITTWPTCSRS